MKYLLNTLFLTLLSSLIIAQTNNSDALTILLNKKQLSIDKSNYFIDQSKQILLPADGIFLYSSISNSGNSAYGYAQNENYVVTITNPFAQKIRIRTDYLLLDNQNDLLQIFDGPDTLHPLLRAYRGVLDNNELIVSSSNKLTLFFKSNNQHQNRGFRLRVDQANLKGYTLSSTASCLNSTPASDACVNAPLVCNLNGYCGNTSGQYTADNTNISFCGSIENNSWLSFIASSSSAQFEFNSAGCQSSSSGIQATIYASSNCSNFTQVSNCVSQGTSSGSFTITTNTPLVAGTKYYIMVDGYAGNVCSYSVTAQNGVATNVQIGASQDQVCPGNAVQLSSTLPSTSYAWTASDGTILPNTATISVTPTVTTTYTLTLGASDCFPAGSMGVKTITVTSTLPPPNITAPNGGCDNSNVTLTSLTNGGTYQWSGPNGFSSTVQNPTINNFSSANAGTYSLIISYGSSCSTQQGTISLAVLTSPTVAINSSPSSAVCAANQITLTATGSTGFQLNPYTWSWNSAETSLILESCINIPFIGLVCDPILAVIPGTGSGPEAIATPSANTQVCVSITGSNGCIGKVCENITLLSNTTLGISPSVTTCPIQPVVLSANSATNYTWEPSASLSSANGSTVLASPLITTIYTVTAIGCNSVVLTNTVEVVVNLNPPFVTAIQSPSVVCPNQTDVIFSVNNISNTNYNWQLPVGAIITSTNSLANEITVNMGSTAGTFSVAVTATNSCGATTQTATIQVSQITLTLSASTPSICAPGSSTLSVSGAYWYNWQPTVGLSVSSGTATNYVASPSSSSIYTVTGTNGACISTTTIAITVINNIVNLIANPTSLCAGQSATIIASSSTATSYTWSTGVTQPTLVVSPNGTTTYSVIGNSTCPEKGFITVVINPNPVISINAPVICANKTATLLASGATTYTWNNGSTNNSIVTSPVNTTNYSVFGTNTFGCVGSQTTVVTVNNPIANFTGMNNAIENTETILTFQNTSSGASVFFWETCNGTSTSATSILVPLQDTGICCVKLYAFQGVCVDSITKCVTVIPPTRLIPPNVFTPNGDGNNDVFKLDAIGIDEITITIFNRWGTKVYDATSTGNVLWDGKTKNGSMVTDGTYFYVLKAKGKDGKDYDLKDYINVFK